VRVTKSLLDCDKKNGLGLLFNPRLLNTAITRATSLLVVVVSIFNPFFEKLSTYKGDPYILSMDKYWKRLIDTCKLQGAYIGPELQKEYMDSRAKQEKRRSRSLSRTSVDQTVRTLYYGKSHCKLA
jgi:superfamily I DNA and/or RNA helicase